MQAWLTEDHPITNEQRAQRRSSYVVRANEQPVAERYYVRSHLGQTDVVLVDARSPAEYRGEDVRAQRGGHIPGAINIEWKRALDPKRQLRFKTQDELHHLYASAGVIPDKQIITYSQTHHRSALTWFTLKYLGYPRVKGYPGSWSDWGNSPDMPIEKKINTRVKPPNNDASPHRPHEHRLSHQPHTEETAKPTQQGRASAAPAVLSHG